MMIELSVEIFDYQFSLKHMFKYNILNMQRSFSSCLEADPKDMEYL